jgi:ferredoxin-NADP reductase/predicted pyridoxine 5'-phosphate oxidase superfamily flavin-nucleotide-binding protein
MTEIVDVTTDSPFHQGEQQVQTLLGVRDKMERFGRKVVRDHMPDQHQAFYRQLPFIFVGHADDDGWPWASILLNEPGFIGSTHPRRLTIDSRALAGDPLADSLQRGRRLGLLGIELDTRRRNRLAAHVTQVSDGRIELAIDQAFGNCPQYIQDRELVKVDPGVMPAPVVEDITVFDDETRALIEASDTFFVASYNQADSLLARDGADVSHRGGKPGFVRVEGNTLTIPDYLGNNHFNTLGNFQLTPKAGLLFLDFERGHLLTLTGRVEILWGAGESSDKQSDDAQHFAGAERLWKFHLDHGRLQKHVLPVRWKLHEYSPNTLLTGSWEEADALRLAQQRADQWLPYKVVKVVDESSVIKSFYLQAQDHTPAVFEAGQFLTIKATVDDRPLIRTYTVSSAPGDDLVRISVKRDGVFSRYLHDSIGIDALVSAKSPRGDFHLDMSQARPAVLLSAGIGITPMLSMARHALIEGFRTRRMRALTLITAARDVQQRGFFDELDEIALESDGRIRSFWTLSQVDDTLTAGHDYHQQGRISAELLQAILPLDDYDFYLCGPSGFMQDVYELLRALGVADARIFAEAFGPASLTRACDVSNAVAAGPPIASAAIVEFAESGVEQAWSSGDGNLLEFAEAHGFSPEFGCRSGQCGACKVEVLAGQVSYQHAPSSRLGNNEALLCCAVPAADVAADGSQVEAVTRLVIAL